MSERTITSICYYNGEWGTGPVPLMTSNTNAAWLANAVFDGARSFEGVTPDLDLHCQRAIRSAQGLHMKPPVDAARIEALAREGIAKFPADTPLYIRPMFWAEGGMVLPDPESTQFALVITRMSLPDPAKGFTACLSSYRRPSPEQAPTHAKAACLYPLAGLALAQARERGFENAVMCDPVGNVAELTAQNVMFARGGVCVTPIPNGTFLNGITRQRVLALLREAGVPVEERSVRPAELLEADEIFSTGNHAKVVPCLRYEGRTLEPGPIYRKARELYWAYAHSRAAVRA